MIISRNWNSQYFSVGQRWNQCSKRKSKFTGLKVLSIAQQETVLGKEIKNKLNFESHMKTLSGKASQKLGSLQKISIFLDPQNKKLLFNLWNINSVTAYLLVCFAQKDWIL